MCGPCLCAPPTLLCSGSLVRSIPLTTNRVSEGIKVLRLVNTFVHDITLEKFPNLERLVERHNPMLQCKSLLSQLASLSRPISVASDCLDQNSPRQSLDDTATTLGVGGGATPTKSVVDSPPTPSKNPSKKEKLESHAPSFWVLVALGIVLVVAVLLWLVKKTRGMCRHDQGDGDQAVMPLIDLSLPSASLASSSVVETSENLTLPLIDLSLPSASLAGSSVVETSENLTLSTTQDDTIIAIHPPPRNPPSDHGGSRTDSQASPPPAESYSSAGSQVLLEYGSYSQPSTSLALTSRSSLSIEDFSQLPPPNMCSTPTSSGSNSPSRASPDPPTSHEDSMPSRASSASTQPIARRTRRQEALRTPQTRLKTRELARK